MMRWLGLLFIAAVALIGWLAFRPDAPPEISFGRVTRQRLESTLATNGKTEPVTWVPVVAPRAARIAQLLASNGMAVQRGAVLAVLDAAEGESEIATAESKVAQIKSELATAQEGGRSSDLVQIDSAIARLSVEREAALREIASLERLLKQQAATVSELNAAKDRLASLDAQVAGERARRKALVAPVELDALRVRMRDAEIALKAARERLEKGTLRASQAGVVYETPVRAGEWVEAGAVVAKIGDTSKLRVIIYVDEPDLGRVRPGMKVALTWDALPGRQWQGEVMSVPVQVVTLGTRQVGEVVMVADNPRSDLPPGANVNASIQSRLIENALTMPKAALRKENGALGVYLLNQNAVEWRPVEVGVSSATLAEVRSGLKEGDAVALPSDFTLTSGAAVRPRLQ